MNTPAVINEFAKMRHLRVGPLVGVMIVLTLGVAGYAVFSDPDLTPRSEKAWNLLLFGICQGAMIASPMLLAVLSSRQVDIEHHGKGWLLSGTSNLAPGELVRAKLSALGLVATAATLLASGIAFATVALALRPAGTIPIGRWVALTATVLVINLVILAVHLVLATTIENQLVGIGIGLLGFIFAIFAEALPRWTNHLLPWGYYVLAMPAKYQSSGLAQISPAYVSVAGLAILATVLFILITGRLDRKEVWT